MYSNLHHVVVDNVEYSVYRLSARHLHQNIPYRMFITPVKSRSSHRVERAGNKRVGVVTCCIRSLRLDQTRTNTHPQSSTVNKPPITTAALSEFVGIHADECDPRRVHDCVAGVFACYPRHAVLTNKDPARGTRRRALSATVSNSGKISGLGFNMLSKNALRVRSVKSTGIVDIREFGFGTTRRR